MALRAVQNCQGSHLQNGGYIDLDSPPGLCRNRVMNGGKPKIEIFKPFGEAFELTKRILFQPFKLRKWLAIGFAAFLSGHFAAGGFGFNLPIGNFNRAPLNQPSIDLEQWRPWLPIAIAVLVIVGLALILVLTWLKARGTFIFTDCLVRNRAAIVEPWREYRKEGNSFFLFMLAVIFGAMLVLAIVFASLAALGLIGNGHSRTSAVTSIGLLVFLFFFWFGLTLFFAVTTYFMPLVMYRQRCRAMEAFGGVVNLITGNAGEFVLFCLFGLVLILAMIVIGTVVSCATCCLAALPYVGTVILLPVFVCLRSFSLLFLRQFGPDYDAWAGIVEVEPPLTSPSTPPPLPS
jgi:hypothetical protein